MKSQDAVERALRLVQPQPTSEGEKQRWRTTLNVLVNDARIEFADQIHASGSRELRALLRKTFPVVASNAQGYAPLAALIADPEPLLVKHFKTSEIYVSGNQRRVTVVPDESAVRLDRTPGFPFATLVNNELLVFDGGAPFVGDITIRGPFVPTLDHIVGQLEEPYVVTLHSLASKQLPTPTRTQAKDLKTVAAESK